jgi:hypothetical protein
MKEEIIKIAKWLEKGEINDNAAKTALLNLFNVSKCDTFQQSKTSQHQGMCDNCRRPFSEH